MLLFLIFQLAHTQLITLDFAHQGLLQTIILQVNPKSNSLQFTFLNDVGIIKQCLFIPEPEQKDCGIPQEYHFMDAQVCQVQSENKDHYITFPKLGQFYLMIRFDPIQKNVGSIILQQYYIVDFITLLPQSIIESYKLTTISSYEVDIGGKKSISLKLDEKNVVINLVNDEFEFLAVCTNCITFSKQMIQAKEGGDIDFIIQCPYKIMVMKPYSQQVTKMKEVQISTKQQQFIKATIKYSFGNSLYSNVLNHVKVQFEFPFGMPAQRYLLKLSGPEIVRFETNLGVGCTQEISCTLDELISGINYYFDLILKPSSDQEIKLEVYREEDQQTAVIKTTQWKPTLIDQQKDGFSIEVYKDKIIMDFAFDNDDFKQQSDKNGIMLKGELLEQATDCSSNPFYPQLCEKQQDKFMISYGSQNQMMFNQQQIILDGQFSQVSNPITFQLECYEDINNPNQVINTYLLNGQMVYDTTQNNIQIEVFNFWKGSVDLTYLKITGDEENVVMYFDGFDVLYDDVIQGLGYSLQYGSKMKIDQLPYECFIRVKSNTIRVRVAKLDRNGIVTSLSEEYWKTFGIVSEDPYQFQSNQNGQFSMINVERSMDTVKISYRGDTLKKISLLFDDEVESEQCKVLGQIRAICDFSNELEIKSLGQLRWIGIGDEQLRILYQMDGVYSVGQIEVMECGDIMIGHKNQEIKLKLKIGQVKGYLRVSGKLGLSVNEDKLGRLGGQDIKQIQESGKEILLKVDQLLIGGEHELVIRGIYSNQNWQYSSQELKIENKDERLNTIQSGYFRLYYQKDESKGLEILQAQLSVQYIKSIGELYFKYAVRRQIDHLQLVSKISEQNYIQCEGCKITNHRIELVNIQKGEYEITIKGIRIQDYSIILSSDYYVSNEILLHPTVVSSTLDYTQLQLHKINGLYPEFIFTLKAYNINEIYIYYPLHYHQPTMNNLHPYCLLNNEVYVECDYLDNKFILVIRNLNYINGSFDIHVKYSAIQINQTTDQQFYVEFHYDQHIQFGFIDDLPNSYHTPSLLAIQDIQLSSHSWVIPLSIQLTIYSQSQIQPIYIQFDHSWFRKDNINKIGSCLLDGKAVECQFKGQLLVVDSKLEGVQQLVLNDIPASQNDQCIQNKIQINNSPFYLSKINLFSFQISKNPKLWKWTLNGQVITTLQLYQGVYSPQLQLIPADSYRIKSSLNLSTPYFNLSNTILYQGEYSITLRIGSLPTTLPATYPTSFFLNDTSYYYNPPQLLIIISSQPAPLLFTSNTQLTLPIFGQSLPLIIHSPYVPLNHTLILQASIPLVPDLRIDFSYNSQLSYSLQEQLNWLSLKSQDQPNVIQTATEINFQILDNPYFKLPVQSIPISISNSDEILYVLQPEIEVTISSIQATSIQVSIIPNQPLIYYYCITLNDLYYTPNRDYLHDYNYCQIKPGQQSYKQHGTNQFGLFIDNQHRIDGLLSQMEYNLTIYAQSLSTQVSKPYNLVFETSFNGDQWWKLRSKTNDLCKLASQLRYSKDKVMDINGYTCANPPPTDIPIRIYYFRPYQEIEQPYINQKYEVELLKSQELKIDGLEYLKEVNKGVVPKIEKYSQIVTNPTNLTITNLKLTTNGFIWAVAEKLNISIKGRIIQTKNQTLSELKLKYQNQTQSYYAFAIYDHQPIDIHFLNLQPQSHYRITLIATTEDPSQYQKQADLVQYEAQTPPLTSFILSGLIMIILYLL